jgi:hypothetical protein
LSPRKNCGPTPYPTANRNIRKKVDLTLPEIVIWPCTAPTITPTSNVLVTTPRLNLPIFMFPSQNPRPSVRKIEISG